MQIRSFEPADEGAVIELWEQCSLTRAWNDPVKDIQRKLQVRPELFLVGHENDELVATAMVGYDGHRGWIYYLGVSPQHQQRGYGRQIMEHAERLLRAEGCPKINLQVRTSNRQAMDFYRRLGYEIDDGVSLGKRLEHDGPRDE
jgi:ribosomal protein S18 acetylase RimI-like enzyme